MHAFVLLIVAAMPLPAYSSEHQQKMHDRTVFEGAERVVFRTSEWPNFEGTAIPVEQKLTVNPDGDLRYDYHAQSPETQAYHRALCAEQGLDAATEGESIFSTDSAGWHCIHVIEYLPGTAPPSAPTARMTAQPSHAADHSYATAPSGTASVGTNFPSTGSANVQSSVPGSVRATVSVDNGRCTRVEGCIPKLCGYATGTMSVFTCD